jgi:type II secretory pathway pseudopilin PulG
MTLVEMLVVIALSAAVVVMGVWIVNTAQRVWLEEQLRVSAARMASQWEYQFSRELRAALPPKALGATWQGTNGSIHLLSAFPAHRFTDAESKELAGKRIENDSIRFTTAQIRDIQGRIRPGIVEYRVERNKQTGIYGIMRKSAPDAAGLETAQEALVARSSVSLDIQYQNKKGLWVSEWKPSEEMPRAIRVAVGALPERPGVNPNVMYFSTEVQLPFGERIER